MCVPCVCSSCVCARMCKYAGVHHYMCAGEENRTRSVDIRAAFFVQNMVAQL